MKHRLSIAITLSIVLLISAALTLIAAPEFTNFTDPVHVRGSSGTATPLFISDQRGLGALAEFRDSATPAVRFLNSGGVEINAPTAIATSVPALVINGNGVSNLFEIRDASTPVFTIQNGGGLVIPNGSLPNRSLFLSYKDVAAAPSIRAVATAIPTTTTTLTTSILGIDTPRNLRITYETPAETAATAGNITVTGIDARGNSTTEQIAVAATAGTQTLTGVVPWVSITSFALPVGRTETISITVVGGQSFGLPVIPATAGNLYHLTVNKTPQAAPTVNTTYGTFDPVSTPAADVDYNVWMEQ